MKWILKSCSDYFPPEWIYEQSNWHLGIRQAPFQWTDGQLSGTPGQVTDLLTTFPRPIECSESPEVYLNIYIPDLQPNEVFGFRVTEVAQQSQTLWPGVFIRPDGVYFRALAADIFVQPYMPGWCIFSLKWKPDGTLQLWINENLVIEDTGEGNELWIKHMVRVLGIFFDIRGSTQWTIKEVVVRTNIEPKLEIQQIDQTIQLSIQNGYPGETYQLQSSPDLQQWTDSEQFVIPLQGKLQEFYRLTQ